MEGELQSRLADLAYEAAFDDSRWPDLLAGLRELVPGAHVTLLLPGPEPALERFHATLEPVWVERYVRHYQEVDPHVPVHLASATVGRLAFSTESVPTAELRRTEFHADWIRPQRLRDDSIFGCIFRRGGPEDFSGLGLWREQGTAALDREDLERVQPLASHLLRAIRLRDRLGHVRAERDALAESADRLPLALLLLDAHGGVVHANRRAVALAARGDGLVFGRDGVRALRSADQRRLAHALADAAAASAGGRLAGPALLRLARPSGREPLEVLVTPLRVGAGGAGPARVALFASAPEAAEGGTVAALAGLYGLTPAQAALAREIAAGRTVEQAAERLGIRLSTARSELKQVFQRMGVSRQAELVRRVGHGVARLARDDGAGD